MNPDRQSSKTATGSHGQVARKSAARPQSQNRSMAWDSISAVGRPASFPFRPFTPANRPGASNPSNVQPRPISTISATPQSLRVSAPPAVKAAAPHLLPRWAQQAASKQQRATLASASRMVAATARLTAHKSSSMRKSMSGRPETARKVAQRDHNQYMTPEAARTWPKIGPDLFVVKNDEPAPRLAARKVLNESDDSDDSDDPEEEEDRSVDLESEQEEVKESDEEDEKSESEDEDSDNGSSSSGSSTDREIHVRPNRRRIVQTSSDGNASPRETPVSDVHPVLRALESLTLAPVKMHQNYHLPFLPRNIRKSFHLLCRALDIPTRKSLPEPVDVVYYTYTDRGNVMRAKSTTLVCPLCTLHGEFQSREMTQVHLEWDHPEFGVVWRQRGNEWDLEIVVPGSTHASMHIEERNWAESRSQTQRLPSAIPGPARSVSTIPDTASNQASRSTTEYTTSLAMEMDEDVKDVKPIVKREQREVRIQPAPATSAFLPGDQQSRYPPHPLGKAYPKPPPRDNLRGPAARPPYFPFISPYDPGDGSLNLYYSCRPGGGRVYDLLGALPMTPFGVMAWAIIDREEEMFEVDDMKDEYKSINALWARWIFLNRRFFISNFQNGCKKFVEDYYEMIHLTAGWDALRFLLLALLANRFLTGHDVAVVLKYYESLTGMDYWY